MQQSYKTELHTLAPKTRDMLIERAPLMDKWSKTECKPKDVGGMEEWAKTHKGDLQVESCDWYHGTWQYLRLLDMVATPPWYTFYNEKLSAILRRKPDANVLISAAADFGMAATLIDAIKTAGTKPTVTLYDICNTPLLATQWYAKRKGIKIETVRDNIITSPEMPLHSYDLIVTDEFLTVLKAEYKPSIVERWRDLLRPGGSVVTTAMLGTPTTPEQRGVLRRKGSPPARRERRQLRGHGNQQRRADRALRVLRRRAHPPHARRREGDSRALPRATASRWTTSRSSRRPASASTRPGPTRSWPASRSPHLGGPAFTSPKAGPPFVMPPNDPTVNAARNRAGRARRRVLTVGFDLDAKQRRELGYKLIDRLDGYFADLADRPVQPPLPARTRAGERTGPLPENGEDAVAVLDEMFEELIDNGFHAPAANYLGLQNPTPTYVGVLADAAGLGRSTRSSPASSTPTWPRASSGRRCAGSASASAGSGPFDGTFTSGGSEANLTGLTLALAHHFPSFIHDGVASLPARPVLTPAPPSGTTGSTKRPASWAWAARRCATFRSPTESSSTSKSSKPRFAPTRRPGSRRSA